MRRTSDPDKNRVRRFLAAVCLNISLVCQVMAAGFGKQAALALPKFSLEAVISSRFYMLSMLCLLVQSLCWPFVLQRFSLSFAYFYMSASYVGILLMSAFLFHEPVTPFNLIGAALIIVGVNIVVRGQAAVGHVAA